MHTRSQLTQRDVARPGRQGRTGRRAADRSRHDARPDGRRREVGRHEVRRRRSVPVRSARQHRLDQRRPASGSPTRSARRASMVGSLVAPVWPPTGGGSAMGSDDEQKAFLTQVRKACAIGRKLRGPRHPPLRRRPHRLGRAVRRTGRRIPPATRRRSPRPSGRPPTSPRTTASGSPPKGRSAGAACTA